MAGEDGVGVAGFGVLEGLADVFGVDDFGFQELPEARLFQGLLGGDAVRGVLGVGDGDVADFGVAQFVEGLLRVEGERGWWNSQSRYTATDVPPDLYAFHRYTGNSAPPLPYSSLTVWDAVPRLSPGLSHPTCQTAYVRFTPSNSD